VERGPPANIKAIRFHNSNPRRVNLGRGTVSQPNGFLSTKKRARSVHKSLHEKIVKKGPRQGGKCLCGRGRSNPNQRTAEKKGRRGDITAANASGQKVRTSNRAKARSDHRVQRRGSSAQRLQIRRRCLSVEAKRKDEPQGPATGPSKRNTADLCRVQNPGKGPKGWGERRQSKLHGLGKKKMNRRKRGTVRMRKNHPKGSRIVKPATRENPVNAGLYRHTSTGAGELGDEQKS